MFFEIKLFSSMMELGNQPNGPPTTKLEIQPTLSHCMLLLLLLSLLLLVLCISFHAQPEVVAQAVTAPPKPIVTHCATPPHASPFHY